VKISTIVFILAALSFLLAAFDVGLAKVDLVDLGFALIALAAAFWTAAR
jgi:hypothetical protein